MPTFSTGIYVETAGLTYKLAQRQVAFTIPVNIEIRRGLWEAIGSAATREN